MNSSQITLKSPPPSKDYKISSTGTIRDALRQYSTKYGIEFDNLIAAVAFGEKPLPLDKKLSSLDSPVLYIGIERKY